MKHKKQILKIILFLLLPAFAMAQPYQPIPDSNAAWIIQQDDGWGNLFTHKFSLSPISNDTTINSISYTKLFFRFDIGDSTYHGAFRNAENGKSYYLPAYEQQEYLLRDFSKIAGDTVKDVAYELEWSWTWVLDFIVDSTEFVNNWPYTYKILYLHTVVEDTIPEQGDNPLVWIEKIGSFGSGILNSHAGGLSIKRLRCMQYNDTIYYYSTLWAFQAVDIEYEYGQCADPVGINEDKLLNSAIKVTPNPFKNRFTLSNLPGSYPIKLSIYNQFGHCVFMKAVLKKQNKLTVELNASLPKGIYILKIQTSNNYLFTQKIIKK